MKTYTYTIFDSNPHTSGGTAWPHQQGVRLTAHSGRDARAWLVRRLAYECAALHTSDGYTVGQVIYTLLWDEDGVLVGNPPTYTLTAEDLGLT